MILIGKIYKNEINLETFVFYYHITLLLTQHIILIIFQHEFSIFFLINFNLMNFLQNFKPETLSLTHSYNAHHLPLIG